MDAKEFERLVDALRLRFAPVDAPDADSFRGRVRALVEHFLFDRAVDALLVANLALSSLGTSANRDEDGRPDTRRAERKPHFLGGRRGQPALFVLSNFEQN